MQRFYLKIYSDGLKLNGSITFLLAADQKEHMNPGYEILTPPGGFKVLHEGPARLQHILLFTDNSLHNNTANNGTLTVSISALDPDIVSIGQVK